MADADAISVITIVPVDSATESPDIPATVSVGLDSEETKLEGDQEQHEKVDDDYKEVVDAGGKRKEKLLDSAENTNDDNDLSIHESISKEKDKLQSNGDIDYHI